MDRLLLLTVAPSSFWLTTGTLPIYKLHPSFRSKLSVVHIRSGFALYTNCLVGPLSRHCNPFPYTPASPSATNSKGLVRSFLISAVSSFTCSF